MKIRLVILLLFVLTGFKSNAANPFKVSKDKKLISELAQLDKNSPKEIENFFHSKGAVIDTSYLGFGFYQIRCIKEGGYISLTGDFYYERESLVSYAVNPMLPEKSGLRPKYLKWYADFFTCDSIQPYTAFFNPEFLYAPISTYKGNFIIDATTSNLAAFMSPESGINYNYRSSLSRSGDFNRDLYRKIRDSITPEMCDWLLYSKNPATRFLAIEYYWGHQELFEPNSTRDFWIERCLAYRPVMASSGGCLVIQVSTRGYIQSKSFLYLSRGIEIAPLKLNRYNLSSEYVNEKLRELLEQEPELTPDEIANSYITVNIVTTEGPKDMKVQVKSLIHYTEPSE